MIKLFFRNEVELNKETKKNTEEFSKRQQFIKKHVGKLHEIQSLPKARAIRNSKEKKASWKYGCISTKACLRQEEAFFSWDVASKLSALLSFLLW